MMPENQAVCICSISCAAVLHGCIEQLVLWQPEQAVHRTQLDASLMQGLQLDGKPKDYQ